MTIRRRLSLLRACDAGATVIEFAIVVPVFLVLLIGAFDVAQMAYANAMLRGAVQEAARSSALETGDTTAADNQVKNAMTTVLPGSTVVTSRLAYFDFTDIGRPEKWDDKAWEGAPPDGACNNGEVYVDENGNGMWDADIGKAGNGSAGDVIVYDVTVTYTPIFTVPDFWNKQSVRDGWGARQLTAKAVRKNQPFAKQNQYGANTGKCS